VHEICQSITSPNMILLANARLFHLRSKRLSHLIQECLAARPAGAGGQVLVRRNSLLITARWVFLVALADLGRDRTCKKPKGQSLFFLVDNGYPEMLPAVEAEEVREMLERTMLQSCVGV
jgi:hypothetical protein